jgi:hypothetical protein
MVGLPLRLLWPDVIDRKVELSRQRDGACAELKMVGGDHAI